MAKRLLIVPGYSDGSVGVRSLGDFFVASGLYKSDKVSYLDFGRMDADTSFRDLADSLDSDFRTFVNERVDVVCHSTGALVVRAWLTMHSERSHRRRLDEPCPIHRLLCFAPANFGSHLATHGRSFLDHFQLTFFGQPATRTGRVVLQQIEQASPFQWELSNYDLHSELGYFNPRRPSHQRCYPFVFAAGEPFKGTGQKLACERATPDTDGIVPISGTSFNTRACSMDFRTAGPAVLWWNSSKYDEIPFAVFAGLDHGSIADAAHPRFQSATGPGPLAADVIRHVNDLDSYREMAKRFADISTENYALLPLENQGQYQQLFFRVRDEVDQVVDDFYLDFYVMDRAGEHNEELTRNFYDQLRIGSHRHSTAGSHRMVLLNCTHVIAFLGHLKKERSRLCLRITGVSHLATVRYETSTFVLCDPNARHDHSEPSWFMPNSTTLVDVILNRSAGTDSLSFVPLKEGAIVIRRGAE